eukprot:TRINITY_DN3729_c0_g1_i5.p1 TRINITY_DN3729_c0_g1~~TRINITY_DN3729_c0_g1_i5.p1  ORF type:complete len:753 (-),score=256.52 TRINITY_DN3729_c0_g1_i5:139-2397(-)
MHEDKRTVQDRQSQEENEQGSEGVERSGIESSKVLVLLAEYKDRVKAIYEKHSPDRVAEVDQILGKYREQILSRPQEANNDQVVARYKDRLESLYKAVCAKYNVEPESEELTTYTRQIKAIYQEHNPAKLAEVDKLIEKYSHQLGVLYQSICSKYDVKPLPELLPQTDAAAAAATSASLAGESSALSGDATATSDHKSSWSTGFLTSGLQTLKSLHGAAEGIREQMEKTFDEAIRSEEEMSAMQVVQGLSRAAEKGAAKADAQEALAAFSESESQLNVAPAEAAALSSPRPDADGQLQQQQQRPSLAPEHAEAFQAEHQKLLREVQKLKSEKESLIVEGNKMSRRVQAVEEKMKAVMAEARRSETQISELEKARDNAQAQNSRLTTRAEKAETQCNEHRAEVRRLSSELEKARQQLQREKGQLQADQQALQMRSRDQSEKERRLEDKIQYLTSERDELRSSHGSVAMELQQALAAVDAAERKLQLQAHETEQLQEQHRLRLEAAEYEFANESMPYQQRIGELEAQLAHQEQKFMEREAVAYRERDKERAELDAAREELHQREALQQRRAREMQDEASRAQRAIAEAADLRREVAEVQDIKEAAQRAREAADGELKLESARRRSAEQRATELQHQLQVIEKLQASTPARPAAPAVPPMVSGATESEMQQLRTQLEAVSRQRDALQQDSLKLQQRLEALQKGGSNANVALAQKFEVALQAIGKLQEELETAQDQRDAYKRQCEQLQVTRGSAGS